MWYSIGPSWAWSGISQSCRTDPFSIAPDVGHAVGFVGSGPEIGRHAEIVMEGAAGTGTSLAGDGGGGGPEFAFGAGEERGERRYKGGAVLPELGLGGGEGARGAGEVGRCCASPSFWKSFEIPKTLLKCFEAFDFSRFVFGEIVFFEWIGS